jgi:hypothetical protein
MTVRVKKLKGNSAAFPYRLLNDVAWCATAIT